MPPPLTLWNNDNAETKALFTIWSKPKIFRHPQATKDVFWLNHQVTSFVLALFVILSSMYAFYDSTDSAIQCYHDKGLKLPKELLNRYCWMMSTFTLPKYFQIPNNETIYPGVGPFTEKDEKKYHAYYQWVPLFLFFQCACFYAPQALWKCMEGGRFKKLVESLKLLKKKKDKDDDDDDDEDAGEKGGKKGGKKGGGCPPKCMCNDDDKKDKEEPLPFGLRPCSRQPVNLGLACFVELFVGSMTDKEYEPMIQHLSYLPPKYRVPEMRSYLVKCKPLNLKQVVECFKGKFMRPDIVKYLVERVSYLDTREFIEWIENGPEKISPLEGFEYLLTHIPESKKVLLNQYNEYRCQDMKHYICEIASFVNLICQIMLTNIFLGYQFFSYGFKALTLLCGESKERTDILSFIFPTMTKCTFHKYGSSGTIETLDSLCVLGVNIVNEKIFLFLWLWFFLLAVCSLGNILYQTYLMFKPDYEPRFLKWIKKQGLPEDETIEYRILMGQLIYHLNFSDWLILYLYNQNEGKSTEWKSVCYLLCLVKMLFPKEERLDNLECWRWPNTSVRQQPGFLSFCSTPSDPVKRKNA